MYTFTCVMYLSINGSCNAGAHPDTGNDAQEKVHLIEEKQHDVIDSNGDGKQVALPEERVSRLALLSYPADKRSTK